MSNKGSSSKILSWISFVLLLLSIILVNYIDIFYVLLVNLLMSIINISFIINKIQNKQKHNICFASNILLNCMINITILFLLLKINFSSINSNECKVLMFLFIFSGSIIVGYLHIIELFVIKFYEVKSDLSEKIGKEDARGNVSEGEHDYLLKSFAPSSYKDYYKHYVNFLNEAVKVESNRNIGVDGLYSSGKSSLLMSFREEYENEYVFLIFLIQNWITMNQI